ncbi:hypothetical protein ACWT_7518 [Actinoplanes sp. SE50]|uniref:hypothetical protein n=1 Tax=unclassified Actinoplanes TaxID=2626549 RepID=UPI00023EDCD7|nr:MULTISPECIES: hypothetical protein [unclassified Actinoplanes]AEV88528.1 hypothetical protein ACPL_7648 [Actinoplanes sp. SE50/110]ATO86933.1 hypothetical protein ACWT_7518 [Actinoplanes sp. SE50]SLM04351.1 hypothetical protein ACSP50_7656 [Actinoplanes sp. SE50/110]
MTLRVTGVVVSVAATLVVTVIELVLSVLRVGGVTGLFHGEFDVWTGTGQLIGLAIPVTVAANLALAWFAVTTVERPWAIGVPWALWTLLVLGAAGTRTAEGDYLLGGDNWVALVMILAGSLAFAVYAYRMIMKPVKEPVRPESEPTDS